MKSWKTAFLSKLSSLHSSGAPETNALVSQGCMQTILLQFAKPIRENCRKLSGIRHLPHFLCIQGIRDFVPYIWSHGFSSPWPERTATNLSKYRFLLLFIQNFFNILNCRGACLLNIEMILEAKGTLSRTDSLLSPFPQETSSHTHRPPPFAPPHLA